MVSTNWWRVKIDCYSEVGILLEKGIDHRWSLFLQESCIEPQARPCDSTSNQVNSQWAELVWY